MLGAAAYRRHSLRTMRAVLDALANDPATRATPTIVFTKGGGGWLDDLAASGASPSGWTDSRLAASARASAVASRCGKPRPAVLLTDPQTIERKLRGVDAAQAPGHIFNRAWDRPDHRRSTSRRSSRPCTPPRAAGLDKRRGVPASTPYTQCGARADNPPGRPRFYNRDRQRNDVPARPVRRLPARRHTAVPQCNLRTQLSPPRDPAKSVK